MIQKRTQRNIFLILTFTFTWALNMYFFLIPPLSRKTKTFFDTNQKSSWKEYFNSSGSYSIEYPSNMTLNEFKYSFIDSPDLTQKNANPLGVTASFHDCTTLKNQDGSFYLAIRDAEAQDSYCSAQPVEGFTYDSLTFLRDKKREVKANSSRFLLTEELYVLKDGKSLIHFDASNGEIGFSLFSPYSQYEESTALFEKIVSTYKK